MKDMQKKTSVSSYPHQKFLSGNAGGFSRTDSLRYNRSYGFGFQSDRGAPSGDAEDMVPIPWQSCCRRIRVPPPGVQD